jgi:cell pole-organizing protein PopZ
MEDILASIRRILSDDEMAANAAPTTPKSDDEDVLVLDETMVIGAASASLAAPHAAPAPAAEPPPADPQLIAPESEAAAAASVGTLLRTLTAERSTEVHRGGPTIEDLVREGIRPMLKSWLDEHLPPMVERIVRTEVERIITRAKP